MQWHNVVIHAPSGPKRLPVGVGMVSQGLRLGRNRGLGASLEPGPKGCLVPKSLIKR